MIATDAMDATDATDEIRFTRYDHTRAYGLWQMAGRSGWRGDGLDNPFSYKV